LRSSFTNKLLLIFWLCSIIISAQIKRFEFTAGDSVTHCRVIPLSENSLLALYTKPIISNEKAFSLYLKKSSDNGVTWGEGIFVDDIRFTSYGDSIPAFAGLKLNSGKIIIIYKDAVAYEVVCRYSNDLVNWSEKVNLPDSGSTLLHAYKNNFSLIQTADNSILFTCSANSRGTYIYKSNDEGMTWRTIKEVTSPDAPFIFNGNNGEVFLVNLTRFEMGKIELTGSSNFGETWDIDYYDIQHNRYVHNPVGRMEKDGTINVWFESSIVKKFQNKNYQSYDIYRVSSTDKGKTWSTAIQVTHFTGQDRFPHMTFYGEKSIMNFRSDRNDPEKRYSFYFGELTDTSDLNAPPYLYGYKNEFPNPDFSNLLINAFVGTDINAEGVKYIFATDNKTDSIELFDDGFHSDGEAGDFVFGNTLYRMEQATNYRGSFSVTDIKKTNAIFSARSIFPLAGASDKVTFNINKFSFSLSNKGMISGLYDGVPVLFSGGFIITGFSNSILWGSGMMPGALVEDYYPGRVGSSADDLKNRIFTIKSTDAAFAPSWQAWKTAVELGARFYDGDKDGIYNPKDLNNNSQWDPFEDRPDLLGDMTAFCVYNDGVPANLRPYRCPPQEIEVSQTVFASGNRQEGAFSNSVFIRYSLVNKNPLIPVMDDVLFGFWGDPDLGNSTDDMIGSDTLHQSVFLYNKTSDSWFGTNPPALFSKVVQGPVGYFAGETYTDVNQNSQYDVGIDIPLDTAFNRLGNYLGYESFPGAKNVPVYATACYLEQSLTPDDPNLLWEVRNSLRGLSRTSGQPINPCNFYFGLVAGGVNCEDINKRMIFSGDPVTNYGWICNYSTDQRTLISTGPFKLEYDKPVDIIVAYVMGRGSDQFNSIDVAREYAGVIQSSYEQNFPEMYSYKEINDTFLIIGSYELFQNHPNPFNPYTIIKYTVESKSRVTVRVFDILGREVATPVDEEKEAGNFQIRFDAGTLSSGVYFYQLHAGDYVSTKKMILLR